MCASAQRIQWNVKMKITMQQPADPLIYKRIDQKGLYNSSLVPWKLEHSGGVVFHLWKDIHYSPHSIPPDTNIINLISRLSCTWRISSYSSHFNNIISSNHAWNKLKLILTSGACFERSGNILCHSGTTTSLHCKHGTVQWDVGLYSR